MSTSFKHFTKHHVFVCGPQVLARLAISPLEPNRVVSEASTLNSNFCKTKQETKSGWWIMFLGQNKTNCSRGNKEKLDRHSEEHQPSAKPHQTQYPWSTAPWMKYGFTPQHDCFFCCSCLRTASHFRKITAALFVQWCREGIDVLDKVAELTWCHLKAQRG